MSHDRQSLIMPCGLPLLVVGRADVPRFVSDFEAVWAAIPPPARQRLIDHWHRPRRKAKQPDLRLHEPPYLRQDDRHNGGPANAACSPTGDRIDFWAPLFRRFPAQAARGVIAHELGHAMQSACAEIDYVSVPEAERQADAIAAAWGFDADVAAAWISEHTLLRGGRRQFLDNA